mmetsp:Transcript_76153/g.120390  ORF Transcript_76153/g.120390 Transcript_76153/m.120390 type:complete len:203 (-) Transcript_76153:59-667(-)
MGLGSHSFPNHQSCSLPASVSSLRSCNHAAFALAFGHFMDTMGKGASVSPGAPALLLIELAHDGLVVALVRAGAISLAAHAAHAHHHAHEVHHAFHHALALHPFAIESFLARSCKHDCYRRSQAFGDISVQIVHNPLCLLNGLHDNKTGCSILSGSHRQHRGVLHCSILTERLVRKLLGAINRKSSHEEGIHWLKGGGHCES